MYCNGMECYVFFYMSHMLCYVSMYTFQDTCVSYIHIHTHMHAHTHTQTYIYAYAYATQRLEVSGNCAGAECDFYFSGSYTDTTES